MTEFRIYGNRELTVWVVVDEEDYHHFVRWRWCASGWGYLKRSAAEGSRVDGTRRSVSKYLHVEIMKRVEPTPPTPAHVLVDHKDLDVSNCRRYNLHWATYSMNVANRHASAWPRGPRLLLPTPDNLLETF